MEKQYVISIKTILTTFAILLAAYVVYRLGPVFAIILISTLIVLALEPLVKYFMKFTVWNRPVSRSLAVIQTYAIFIIAIVAVFTIGLPPVISQAQRLLMNLASLLSGLNVPADSVRITDIIPQLSQFTGNVFKTLTSGFMTLTSVFTILMLSIYMSLDWENLKHKLLSVFKEPLKEEMTNVVEEVETNVGHWVKGQLVLMFVIGTVTFVGLSVLRVDYPLAL
ncbi:MAG TPA: AI-2E family transporter, partial [Patescibacteria group bacterium]|nr:AI-2E family transporter [Patescibacteria group bacterium]